MDRWRRFRRLPRGEQRLFLAALVWLPVMAAALKLFRLRPLLRGLERLSSRPAPALSSSPPTPDALLALSAARMVAAAARHGVVRAACLPRSLTLWWLLRRRGVPSELRIGTRKRAAEFRAHAWVEAAGLRLDETSALDYTPLDAAVLSSHGKL